RRRSAGDASVTSRRPSGIAFEWKSPVTFDLNNLDQLVRKPAIEKPAEDFLLPPPLAIEPPEPVDRVQPTRELPAPPSHTDQLHEESARVEELIQLLTETAEPVI